MAGPASDPTNDRSSGDDSGAIETCRTAPAEQRPSPTRRSFTASGRKAGAGRLPQLSGDVVLAVSLIVSLAWSSLAILRDSGVVPAWPMDQSFAQIADIAIRRENGNLVFHYPDLQNSGGITSVLIAGLYKLVIPTTAENLNWHIRILGMAGYLLSSFWLILKLIQRSSARLIAFILIAASGFQFVQPTSELFGATCLNLFLAFALQRLPVLIGSGLLVTYGLCKVELIPSSLCLAALWLWHEWQDRRKRILIPATVAGWYFIFLYPSLLINGTKSLSGGRSWEAFKVKYTSLFHPHQINAPSEDPWGYSHQTIDKIFPDNRKSIARVIFLYPRLYLDYFALALTQSVLNLISGIKFLLLPSLLLIARRPAKLNPELHFAAMALLIVVITGLGPAVFMGFVHIRYVMRYFPLIVAVLVAIFLESQSQYQWQKPLVWLCLLATLAVQIMQLPSIYANSHFL